MAQAKQMIEKILNFNAIVWIFILIFIRWTTELFGIADGHDFFVLFVTLFIFSIAIFYLGFRHQLRPFILGATLLSIAAAFDWLDSVLAWNISSEKIMDVMDDFLFASGVFFIGLAFIKVMLERDKFECELYHQAYVDELTGLGNRRALFEKLDCAIKTQHGTLFYIDLNNFKQVNDCYGHALGDTVLQKCAAVILACDGLGFRIGGDEFVLLITGKIEHQLIEDKLQQSVQQLNIEYGIGFSIGVISFSPNSFITADALINQADTAMYLSKNNFRKQSREESTL
jgi:diguanylate cyclase (GGDEF)-like protein